MNEREKELTRTLIKAVDESKEVWFNMGFQKGKLEQKKIKKELFWVYTNILEDFGEWDKIEIEKRIKQLQKEIKVSGDSLTEFWDNPEDDRWDKEEDTQK